MFQRLTALALVASISSISAQASETWYGDFDVASAAAKKAGKDLFVDFTGSDWCHWCIKLHEEVLGIDEFVAGAQKDYILVSLDFPRSEEALAKVPDIARNKELAKKYNIQGYPTVLLMDADGTVFARTGYQAGGAEKYLAHLAEIGPSGKLALTASAKVLADFEAASDDASKWQAWEACVKAMEGLDAGSPFAEQLAGPVRWAITADAQNAKGMKKRALTSLLTAGFVDEDLMTAGRELDPMNADGLLEMVVQAQFGTVRDEETARAAVTSLLALNEQGIKDKELGFKLNFTAAQWCAGPLSDDTSLASVVAAARAIGNDDAEAIKALDALLEG
ncbi:MAG: thiol-disulfide isomerase/thioredoxin [Chlamydiales bacterium]